MTLKSNIVFILFFSTYFLLSAQNSKKEYTAENGLTFKAGDTLIFNSSSTAEIFTYIFKGKGLSIKRLSTSLIGTKCIIDRFKRNFGYQFAFCNDLND